MARANRAVLFFDVLVMAWLSSCGRLTDLAARARHIEEARDFRIPCANRSTVLAKRFISLLSYFEERPWAAVGVLRSMRAK
jgi:hypothetical protein